MKTRTKFRLSILTECSIMVALSTVLSVIKLLDLPYGGSVTIASMLPMVIIAYRHGTLIGLGTSCLTAAIQLLLGLNTLSYFTTWYSVLAIILLDYIVAFAVFGLSGIFRGRFRSQGTAILLGTLLSSLLRYVCHVISGATLWAGLSIPTGAALVYSLGYNATYMIPETVVLLLATLYVGSSLDLTRKIPVAKVREKLNTGAFVLVILAGIGVLFALIADTVLVFSKLQNSESGEFMIEGLLNVSWGAVGIITATAAALAVILILISRKISQKSAN